MLTSTDTALLRLLQLSSSALPVGAYSFSWGLEYAIEEGWINSADDLEEWIALQLKFSLSVTDLPLLIRQIKAARCGNSKLMDYWNTYTLACRETDEFRRGEIYMGLAIFRLLKSLGVPIILAVEEETTFIAGFAQAAASWQIDWRTACHGYAWSWLENQVLAATKIMSLGQNRAQLLLSELLPNIPPMVDNAASVEDEFIGGSLPGLAMASTLHETQYSRLFRS